MSTESPGECQTPESMDWDELESASRSTIDSDHESSRFSPVGNPPGDEHESTTGLVGSIPRPGLEASSAASAIGSNNLNPNRNVTTTDPYPFFAELDRIVSKILSRLPERSEEEKFFWLALPIMLEECDRNPNFPNFGKLAIEYECLICERLKVRADKYRGKTGQQSEKPEGENQSMDEEIAHDDVGMLLVSAGNILLDIYHEDLRKSLQECNNLEAALSKIYPEINDLEAPLSRFYQENLEKVQEECDSKYDTEQLLNTSKRTKKLVEVIRQLRQEMKRLIETEKRVKQELHLNHAKFMALQDNLAVVSNTDSSPSLSSLLLQVHSYRVLI